MEYFILNEHSLSINNPEIVDDCLKSFFDVYKRAVKNNFKQIRVSENIDTAWYEINVGQDTTIRNWISKQSKDYSNRLKSLITATQSPIFSPSEIKEKFRYDLSEFKYHDSEVPCLGAAYLLKQLSLSFDSTEIWNASQFQIEHMELTEEDENNTIETIEQKVIVKNATTVAHWEEHYTQIEQKQIAEIQKSQEIIKELDEYFPNIIFTTTAKKQLQNNNFTPTFFGEIWEVLKKLNNAIKSDENVSLNSLKTNSQLSISDESDTVKNNDKLARHRNFFYQGERHFFGYHVKNFTDKYRLHFIIDNNKIVIGYIGKHLPTKKF